MGGYIDFPLNMAAFLFFLLLFTYYYSQKQADKQTSLKYLKYY